MATGKREVGRSRHRRHGGGCCDCPCAHPAAGRQQLVCCMQDRAYTVRRQHHKCATPCLPFSAGDISTTLLCMRDTSHLPAG